MFTRSILITLGVIASIAVTPSTVFAQKEAQAATLKPTLAVRIAAARDAVLADRVKIQHLEDLIERQRGAMATGWGFPLGPDYWDRVFTLGGPPRVLANLELDLSRAYTKFSRDQARLDSLELYATR